MKKWITEMLSSEGNISSKRVIAFGAFALLAIGFLSNLYFGFTIEEFMYETMSYIVIAGLGFTASEFFANVKRKGGGPTKENEEPLG